MRNHTKKFLGIIRYTILTAILISTALKATNKQNTLVLFDTGRNEQILYQAAIQAADNNGFNVTYFSLNNIMDEQNLNKKFAHTDTIFFIFDSSFLKNILLSKFKRNITRSPFVTKVLSFIRSFSQKPNKLIGFIFPPFSIKRPTNIVEDLSPIFKSLKQKNKSRKRTQKLAKKHAKSFTLFSRMANNFFSKPIISRPRAYHTTLNPPRLGTRFYSPEIYKILENKQATIKLLPEQHAHTTQKYHHAIQQTFPYGLYWFNDHHKNHVFISSTTIFSSGIEENFNFVPISVKKRQNIYSAIDQVIHELKKITRKSHTKKHNNKLFAANKTSIDTSIDPSPSIGLPIKAAPNPLQKTAWMEITAFAPPKKLSKRKTKAQHKARQDKLVDYILEAKLDALWITFNPQSYYSPIAREKKKEQTFLKSISCFTKKLKKAAKRKKQAIPKILVGFEITNNIYSPNKPKDCAIDMYGLAYRDLPAPLSKTFWHNEIKKPLARFVKKWSDPKISHGIPLSGVVIDLEMYCRKTRGDFSHIMGFDPATIKKFTQKKLTCTPTEKLQKLLTKNYMATKNIHDFTQQLMDKNLAGTYFMFLEQEAIKLGQTLRTCFTEHIPNSLIVCYAPTIYTNWFYKGLYKGLQTKDKPLYLFTFNTEFNAYQNWFEQNNIHAYHSSVLLLSKVQRAYDFTWVNHILKYHNGIWLNRFSRLIEDYEPTSWINIEQTPISHKQKTKFMKHIKKTSQKNTGL